VPRALPPRGGSRIPEWRVEAADANLRLDLVLSRLPEVGSRARARGLVESGKVDLDGVRCEAGDCGRKLASGSVLRVEWSRPGTSPAAVRAHGNLREAGLNILHADDHLVAVNKAPGILTDTATRQQARERDSVRERVQELYKARGLRVHVVHRLDRDTSGVVLLAASELARAHLRAQFQRGLPARRYLAILQGRPEPAEASWEDWMRWDTRRLLQVSAREGQAGAALGRARIRTLGTWREGLSLVEVALVTGRRNQIRLQAMLRGIPLIGERLYLPDEHERVGPPFPRQALHATGLTVVHPGNGKKITFESEMPSDMTELLSRIGA
jgi:RluA family pseudouridine synthase